MKRRAFVTLMALMAPIAALAAKLGLARDAQWDFEQWQRDLISVQVSTNREFKILRFRVRNTDAPSGHEFEAESAYTHCPGDVYDRDGLYIGDPKKAWFLTYERGLTQLEHFPAGSQADYDHPVPVTIGVCPEDGKWYGWSHRAIHGFNGLDMIFEEDFGDDSTPFSQHGSKPIKTWEDAKLSAGRFAQSVS